MRRAEYVELCKQMTSRNHPLDYYRGIRDRILEILEEDVRGYLESLSSRDWAVLVKDFNKILLTVPKAESDPDPLSTINVLSFQISILFTQYEIKNSDINDPINTNYPTTMVIYHFIIRNYDWKDHATFKKKLRTFGESRLNFRYLLNPPLQSPYSTEPPPIFMVFLGFLKIDEIVESYLNNVFFLGLSYKSDYVDGGLMTPFVYLHHDIFHYEVYRDNCIDTIFMQKLREFYEYVKGYDDKSIRYSINLALFSYLHESGDCIQNKELFKSQDLFDSIMHSLEQDIPRFCDLEMLGKAIPGAYRELVEGSTIMLKEGKVIKYLELVAERFVTSWDKFMESANHRTK